MLNVVTLSVVAPESQLPLKSNNRNFFMNFFKKVFTVDMSPIKGNATIGISEVTGRGRASATQ